MFGISLTMLVMVLVAGLLGAFVAAYGLRKVKSEYQITPREFVVCAVVLILSLWPTGAAIGKVAQDGATGGYVEFWNGSLTAAKSREIRCERDGSCRYTYPCDPYPYTEFYTETEYYSDTEFYIDTNGNSQSRTVTKSRSVTKSRIVTKYHDCPYTTVEYDYWLEDSFGESHSIADNIFAETPLEWRPGTAVPQNVGRGVPPTWQAAKTNIEAGDADPVTKTNRYTNYLLASQGSLLKSYSDSIEKYQEMDLLPDHTLNLRDDPIYDGYKADKVVFVGDDLKGGDGYADWQQSLGRLNSYLGNELQGDLHVVLVPASRITDPDDYTNALLAHWQSPELGKLGLAKNAIMVVIGVDDRWQTVEWSRAKTGIPIGNGEMLAALSFQLEGEPLVPETLLGRPRATPTSEGLRFTASDGVVERIVMDDYPYMRPCMDCEDEDDNGSGLVYLKSSAYVGTGAQVTAGIVYFLLGVGVFVLAAMYNFDDIRFRITGRNSPDSFQRMPSRLRTDRRPRRQKRSFK